MPLAAILASPARPQQNEQGKQWVLRTTMSCALRVDGSLLPAFAAGLGGRTSDAGRVSHGPGPLLDRLGGTE